MVSSLSRFRLRSSTVLLVGCLVVSAWGRVSLASGESAGHAADTAHAAEVATSAETTTVDHATDAGHSDHAAGGHGSGHDELDPTHMNLTDAAMEPFFDWRTQKAVASAIVFGLLLLVLTTYAWKPISEGLANRERLIADNISSAEESAKTAAAKLAEYEAKISAANEEAQQLLATARKDAEASGQRLIAAAQEEAARQRVRAVEEIESAKRVALNELAEKSSDVAVSLAQRIIGREVNAADHQSMIQDMLAKLPSRN